MSVAWVDASRKPKVPGTNAHASALTPIVFMLVHTSWITFGLVMASVIGVAFLSIKGREVSWLRRKFKGRLREGRISARPSYYRRRTNRIQSYGESDISVFRKVN